MRALKERVAAALRTLAPAGTRVLVALSGGPDSVALTHLLRELQTPCGFVLAGVVHMNHGLRGAHSDADEAFCRTLADSLGLPCLVDRADVAAAARESRTSLEDAGRRLRYAFFERARQELGADAVAVAHTRDDQAETFLLRLVRGAGARGLASMRARRGRVIRPLLDIDRADLHRWLTDLKLPFRTDETNADVRFPRNRVRHEVLPALARISPAASRSIARAARLAAADEDFLERRAIEVASTVVLSEEDRMVRLDRDALARLDPALARRVVRRALFRVAPDRFVSWRNIDAVRRLRSGQLDLPGAHLSLDSGELRLTPGRRNEPGRREELNVFRYPLSIPGEVCIQESGVTISAEIVIGGPVPTETHTDVVSVAFAVQGTGGLFVRNRIPGDRFRPFGMSGRKKLQDYLVDRKVPRSERDRVPLVVNGADQIVWVVGHTVAEDFRVTDPKRAVLLLKVRHSGGTV